MNNTSPLNQFLSKHFIKKDEKDDITKPVTNTRIGDKTTNIYGGSYHIPDSEYEAFLKIYLKECIKGNKKEYLTEAQLKENGPILVDVDFRYDYSVTQRLHTREHITDLITLYLEEFKNIYEVHEDVKIPFFVFEKNTVNRLEDKKLTKDGIHIIIGLQCINHELQQIIRASVVSKIDSIWADIPIVNTWEEVFDEGISKGHTNFQLYGSMKPNHEAYKLVTIYHGGYEENGETKFYENQLPSVFETEQNIYKLSVRYPNHVGLIIKTEMQEKLQSIKEKNANERRPHNGGGGAGARGAGDAGGMDFGAIRDFDSTENEHVAVKIEEILAIRTQEELDSCITRFLESLDLLEYNLRDAYEYTMSLPKTFYGEGSFNKWIRVGWALRNISNRLFIVWLAFSSQTNNFKFMTDVSELYEKWKTFEKKDMHSLTIRSLMYWSKNENPEGYKKIMSNSIDAYINKTLENAVMNSSEDDSKIMGFTDYDLASVLYHLYKEEYVCVSIKANVWYRFNGNLWTEIDSGTTLRGSISKELRALYRTKLGQLGRFKLTLTEADPIRKKVERKIQIICSISEKLGKTNDKNNIMREAKELFYDSDFLHKIDSNPYIICFKNCVVDFKEKKARIGKPEDYLTKCTGILYREINEQRDGAIINEIEDFMRKLFPNNELYKYMWQHLASTLIGTTSNQTFNMYIGVGQNGKSVLVNLMEQVLGQYKGDVPLTLITQQRTKIGGVSPEIVQLKGIRYAVMQEPSKGDRINEGIMKQLSAGDPLTGRAPYMVEAQTFTPQFKLVVCSNEFMEIKSQDHGTWRRIRVVDFESLFTETPRTDDPEKPYQYKLDKNIKEKFCQWKEVFASMLVEIAYKMEGNVEDCEKVLSSSKSYRKGQDVLSEYVFERIQAYPTGCITKGQLVSDFKEWFSLNYGNGKMNNAKDLVSAMDRHFGKNSAGIWKGARFAPIVVMDNEDDCQNNNEEEDECDFDLREL
jgi:P4 family phage/plasmid primase-like protien